MPTIFRHMTFGGRPGPSLPRRADSRVRAGPPGPAFGSPFPAVSRHPPFAKHSRKAPRASVPPSMLIKFMNGQKSFFHPPLLTKHMAVPSKNTSRKALRVQRFKRFVLRPIHSCCSRSFMAKKEPPTRTARIFSYPVVAEARGAFTSNVQLDFPHVLSLAAPPRRYPRKLGVS
jgi:hypothetical protein